MRGLRHLAAVLTLCLLAVACSAAPTVAIEAERAAPATVAAGEDAPTAVPPTVVAQPEFEPTTPPTTPPVAAAEPTAEAEAAATATPLPTQSVVPTPQPEGPCNAGPLALPDPDRPVYDGAINIDPVAGTVVGEIAVQFTPDAPIDELYFRLWPNGPRPAAGGVAMTVDLVTLEGVDAEFELVDPTTVRVPLDDTIPAGEVITAGVSFDLVVPIELKSRLSGREDYMRLGTILPLLPWEPGRGWALDPATSLFAEAVSSPVADYRINITVPEGYDVLSSGVVDDQGTWSVESARDFALTVGRFRLVTGIAMAPEPVQITVGVHETVNDDAQAYLNKIIDSLEQFSNRWGQYPWPSLTFAITPNLGGGIEFPTHIMQGPDTIGRTTSHEVGHMFFYSLVGNNQGAAPWLDEGITSYAEFTYEGVGAGAYGIPGNGIGNATQPMTFWEDNADIYYRSVYGQTGFALLQLGSQADVDCALARYVAANAHQIATAEDFIAAFEPTFPNVVADLAALGVILG